MAQTVKCLSTMRETWVWSLGWEDSLEKEMATHSSTLALKIPWTEELGAGYWNKALEEDVWAVTLPLVEFYLLATYKASRTLTPLAQHVLLPSFSFAGVAATCWDGSIWKAKKKKSSDRKCLTPSLCVPCNLMLNPAQFGFCGNGENQFSMAHMSDF